MITKEKDMEGCIYDNGGKVEHVETKIYMAYEAKLKVMRTFLQRKMKEVNLLHMLVYYYFFIISHKVKL